MRLSNFLYEMGQGFLDKSMILHVHGTKGEWAISAIMKPIARNAIYVANLKMWFMLSYREKKIELYSKIEGVWHLWFWLPVPETYEWNKVKSKLWSKFDREFDRKSKQGQNLRSNIWPNFEKNVWNFRSNPFKSFGHRT